MNSIILVLMVFIIAITLSVLNVNHFLATLFFIVSIVLYSIVAYKYSWYFFESIALEDLKPDLWIIHAPIKKISLIIFAIFIAALFAYIGICVFNLIRE